MNTEHPLIQHEEPKIQEWSDPQIGLQVGSLGKYIAEQTATTLSPEAAVEAGARLHQWGAALQSKVYGRTDPGERQMMSTHFDAAADLIQGWSKQFNNDHLGKMAKRMQERARELLEF